MDVPNPDEIHGAVKALFETARDRAPDRFLDALVPVIKMRPSGEVLNVIPYSYDGEMAELCDFANQFGEILSALKDTKNYSKLQIRIKALLYCHILEADFPYFVFNNLFRVIEEKECRWPFVKATTGGKEREVESPTERISELKEYAPDVEPHLGLVLDRLWKRKLRNAFSHAQYYISDDGFEGTKETYSLDEDKRREPYAFTHDQVHQLFEAVQTYLKAFIEEYKAQVKPYQDGEPHRISTGFVQWDRFRWLWCQENSSGPFPVTSERGKTRNTQMHQRKIESISKKLGEIAENAGDVLSRGKRHTRMMAHKDVAFSLADDWLDSFDSLVEELYSRNSWERKFSKRYIRGELQRIIAENRKSGDIREISTLFHELVTEIESFDTEQVVYIPLIGIQLEVDEVVIGPVVLRKISADRIEEMTDRCEKIVAGTTSNAKIKKKANAENRETLESLRGKVCAESRIVAEPTRAREKAGEATHQVLDLLRYSIPPIYRKDFNVAVGIEGEAPSRTILTTPVISAKGERYSIAQTVAGPVCPFKVDTENLSKMKRIGVFKASRILKKPQETRTEFEAAILRGIHWFADAQIQADRDNAFLSLMICLETFLTPLEKEPVTAAIAEGVALILGENLQQRKGWKGEVKSHYGKRCRISHGGKSSVSKNDLAALTETVGRLLMWTLDNSDKFDSIRSLQDWLEDRKLS